jgi:hypothetical protein
MLAAHFRRHAQMQINDGRERGKEDFEVPFSPGP